MVDETRTALVIVKKARAFCYKKVWVNKEYDADIN